MKEKLNKLTGGMMRELVRFFSDREDKTAVEEPPIVTSGQASDPGIPVPPAQGEAGEPNRRGTEAADRRDTSRGGGVPCEQEPVVDSAAEDQPTSTSSLPIAPDVAGRMLEAVQALSDRVETVVSAQAELSASLMVVAAKVISIERECIEKDYKAALLEAQRTIREMSMQIRNLEDKRFREDVLKPMMRDIVLPVADDLAGLRTLLGVGTSASLKQAADFIDAMDEGMMSAIARYGVTRMPRDVFSLDTRRQKVVRVEQVRLLKDGEILNVERNGYEWDGQVLRLQEVAVRKVG